MVSLLNFNYTFISFLPGLPYGTVNLRHGVPPGETSVTCTAGVGTFVVEFGTLSRLTNNPLYEDVRFAIIIILIYLFLN